MKRTLEPEIMRGHSAAAYAETPFASVNEEFGRALLATFPDIEATECAILDAGCGPGDIAVWVARRSRGARITALDASDDMLAVAVRRIAEAGLSARVSVTCARVPEYALPEASFDYVIANGFVHHLPEPRDFWQWARRLLKPGGGVFVRDLRRPSSADAVEALVDLHGDASDSVMKDDFRSSFHAALTVEEVAADLLAAGFADLQIDELADRYWFVRGRIPR